MSNASFTPGRHGYQHYVNEVTIKADVCIVGAGAGGTAAAAAMADRGMRVALLEEGSHWRPSQFKPDTSFAFRNLYQNRGARSLRGNAVIPLPGGRGVGGSTLINSAICFRCPGEVLERWRSEYGCEHFQSDIFEAVQDRIWDRLGVTVNPVEVQRNNNLIFGRARKSLA